MTNKKTFFALILSAVMCVPFTANAQVTIGSGDAPRATLDVRANDGIYHGIIPPQVTRAQLNETFFPNALRGAIVYVEDFGNSEAINQTEHVTGIGLYVFDGLMWLPAMNPIASFPLTIYDNHLRIAFPGTATTPAIHLRNNFVMPYHRGALPSTNLNEIRNPGFYRLAAAGITNGPADVTFNAATNSATLQVMSTDANRVSQLLFHNNGSVYSRVLQGTAWTAWIDLTANNGETYTGAFPVMISNDNQISLAFPETGTAAGNLQNNFVMPYHRGALPSTNLSEIRNPGFYRLAQTGLTNLPAGVTISDNVFATLQVTSTTPNQVSQLLFHQNGSIYSRVMQSSALGWTAWINLTANDTYTGAFPVVINNDNQISLAFPGTATTAGNLTNYFVMPYHRGAANTNLNEIRNPGFYRLTSTATTNLPAGISINATTNSATLQVMSTEANRVSQLLFHNTGRVFSRVLQNTTWTAWVDLTANDNDVGWELGGNQLTAADVTAGLNRIGTRAGSNQPIGFITNGLERVRITSGTTAANSGFVGIGTAAPAHRLHISGTTEAASSFTMSRTGTGSDSPVFRMVNANAGPGGIPTVGQMLWCRETNVTASNASAWMQASIITDGPHAGNGAIIFGTRFGNIQRHRLVIYGNGFLGVGLDVLPTQALDVGGHIRIRGGASHLGHPFSNSPRAGAVLTARDSDGTAEWRMPNHSNIRVATTATVELFSEASAATPDYTIAVQAASPTVNLPNPADRRGQFFVITFVGTAAGAASLTGTVTIATPEGGAIRSSRGNMPSIRLSRADFSGITVQSDGTNWIVTNVSPVLVFAP